MYDPICGRTEHMTMVINFPIIWNSSLQSEISLTTIEDDIFILAIMGEARTLSIGDAYLRFDQKI